MTEIALDKLNIKSGPAGRAIAQPRDEDLIDALAHHLTMERNASAQYFAMSLWIIERELRGFGEFFNKESFMVLKLMFYHILLLMFGEISPVRLLPHNPSS